MQHSNKTIGRSLKQKLKIFAGTLAWTTGLILAGSDGPMLPYINGLGVALFAGASLWLGRWLSSEGRQVTMNLEVDCPGRPRTIQPGPRAKGPAGRRMPMVPDHLAAAAVRPRYARELGVV